MFNQLHLHDYGGAEPNTELQKKLYETAKKTETEYADDDDDDGNGVESNATGEQNERRNCSTLRPYHQIVHT